MIIGINQTRTMVFVICSIAVLFICSFAVLYCVLFYSDNYFRRWSVHRKVRLLAASARAHPSDPNHAKELLRLARGRYSFGATIATAALGSIGNAAEPIVPDLATLLYSSDGYVSREAAISLGQLGRISAPALKTLEDIVENGNPESDTTWFAAEAIGNIGAPAIGATELLRSKLGRSRQFDECLRAAIARLQEQ